MRVGNIQFSDEFFTTTQTVREVKQVLENELVSPRSCHVSQLATHATAPSVCAAQLLHPGRARKNTVRSPKEDGMPLHEEPTCQRV